MLQAEVNPSAVWARDRLQSQFTVAVFSHSFQSQFTVVVFNTSHQPPATSHHSPSTISIHHPKNMFPFE